MKIFPKIHSYGADHFDKGDTCLEGREYELEWFGLVFVFGLYKPVRNRRGVRS